MANMFTHQFDLDRQKIIVARMVRLLPTRKRSMIMGTSTGKLDAKTIPLRPRFCEKVGDKMIYRQSKETMSDLWAQAVTNAEMLASGAFRAAMMTRT